MRCAILPVFCSGTERRTTVTKAWLERAADAAKDYYHRQSGARVNLTFTVFEWRQIAHTTEDWVAAGVFIGRQVHEAMAAMDLLNPDEFDQYVVLIDDQASRGGRAPDETPEACIIAAADVTPTLIAHELGHRFHAGHTYLEGPGAPLQYGGPFCVMGHEATKHDFLDPSLNVASEGATPDNARSGPGMCFPNLVRAGWADPAQHALRLRPYAGGSLSAVVELGALDGAPPAGQPGLPVACIIELDDWYLVEYRSPTSAHDRGVPNSVPPRRGSLVLYRSPAGSQLAPLQVRAGDVLPGGTISIGPSALAVALADRIGGSPGMPLQLTVLNVDPGGRKVSLRVECRLGRPPLYESTDELFDFLQWAVVGRDFGEQGQEGLMPLLSSLAEIHHLSRLRGASGPRDRAALGDALQIRIAEFQRQVRDLRP